MSPSLDSRGREHPHLAPLSRDEFAELEHGDRLQDRRGRVWSVHTDAYRQDGLDRVVLRSGDLVKIETERFADDYMLLDDVAGER